MGHWYDRVFVFPPDPARDASILGITIVVYRRLAIRLPFDAFDIVRGTSCA